MKITPAFSSAERSAVIVDMRGSELPFSKVLIAITDTPDACGTLSIETSALHLMSSET